MSDADKKLADAREKLRQQEELAASARHQEAANKREREGKFSVGKQELQELRHQLTSKLQGVPRAGSVGSSYKAGPATLIFREAQPGLPTRVSHDWDVVAWAPIEIHCETTNYSWGGTVVYADRGSGLQLWELGFFAQPLSSKRGRHEPYGLDPREREFADAVSPAMATSCIAFEPLPLSGDQQQREFLERWGTRFADAMNGELVRPSHFPI